MTESEGNLKGKKFQSTPSARRETLILLYSGMRISISIHSLREEVDQSFGNFYIFIKKFQSTPSARRETIIFKVTVFKNFISIHSLREEGDKKDTVYNAVV